MLRLQEIPYLPPERVEQMIQQRLLARANKNYSEADRIRTELLEADIMLEDGPRVLPGGEGDSSTLIL